MKFEKVKRSCWSEDSETIGYKLGNYYVLKQYLWQNIPTWIVSDEKKTYSFNCEFDREFNNNKFGLVRNCTRGKEILVKLYNGEMTYDDVKGHCL